MQAKRLTGRPCAGEIRQAARQQLDLQLRAEQMLLSKEDIIVEGEMEACGVCGSCHAQVEHSRDEAGNVGAGVT